MKKKTGIILATIGLFVCISALAFIEVGKHQKKKLVKEFTKEFIEQYPTAIPLINGYNECSFGWNRKEPVEGCEAHVTKNKEEKDLLIKYLREKEMYVQANG